MRPASAQPVYIDEVADTVANVAGEVETLASKVLDSSKELIATDVPFTQDHLEATATAMRNVLEQEDLIAARAKDALAAARKASQAGADDVSAQITASALAAYEMSREMRTRTRENLARISEIADGIGESGSEALTHVQEELQLRISDGRAFTSSLRDRAHDLLNRM